MAEGYGPLRVRSRDPGKVLDGMTRPTPAGAGKLTFRQTRAGITPPEFSLLLRVLEEEFGCAFELPRFELRGRGEVKSDVREKSDPYPYPRVVTDEGWTVESPLRLTCEFDLLAGELRSPKRGPVFAVVFHGLSVAVDRGDDRRECHRDVTYRSDCRELSGVFRVSRHRGEDEETLVRRVASGLQGHEPAAGGRAA